MEKEIARVIELYRNPWARIHIYLKYLLTPFNELHKALPRKGTILDVGSGTGMYDFYLKFKAQQRAIEGFDINIRQIAYANETAEKNRIGIKFSYADLDKEYRLKKYKAYLVNDVLHHIRDASKKKLLKKIHENMQKGDILVIKEMDVKPTWKIWTAWIIDKMMTGNGNLYYNSMERMMLLFKETGFSAECKIIRGSIFPHVIYTCTKNA